MIHDTIQNVSVFKVDQMILGLFVHRVTLAIFSEMEMFDRQAIILLPLKQ